MKLLPSDMKRHIIVKDTHEPPLPFLQNPLEFSYLKTTVNTSLPEQNKNKPLNNNRQVRYMQTVQECYLLLASSGRITSLVFD